MKKNEMTKSEKFLMALEFVQGNRVLTEAERTILSEFFVKERESLAKKNKSGSAKKDLEREEFFDIIRDVLAEAPADGMSCAMILADSRIKEFPWKDGKTPTSSSRLTSALTYMTEPTEEHPERLGDLKRTVVKKVPMFSLA